MNRVKLYNFTTKVWDTYEGNFEVNGELLFDFPTDNYVDASGNVKVVVQRYQNGSWVTVSSSSGSSLYEAQTTGAYVKLDKDGLVAYNGSKNTLVVDKDGKVSVEGNITATSGTFTGPVTIGTGGSLAVGTDITLNSNGLTMTKGSINLGNGVFAVTNAGALTASSATITGTVNAKSGYFGTGTSIVSIGDAGLTVGTGGSVGNAAGTFLLNNSGITASAGTIGGWTIGSTLSSPNSTIVLDPANQKMTISTGLVIGQYTSGVYGIQLTTSASKKITLDGSGLVANDGTSDTFKINSDGSVTLSGNITATGGTIGGWTIDAVNKELKSGNITISAKNELITINTGAKIGKYDGTNYGISATAGIIGGWTITADGLTDGNIALDSKNKQITIGATKVILKDDGSGNIGKLNLVADGTIYSGTSSTNYQFKIDTSGNAYFKGDVTGASGTFSGKITASTGSIGGWDINTTSISKNNVVLDSTGQITLGATSQLKLDSTNGINANDVFKVDLAGNLTATSATIKGKVDATSGSFSGVDITGKLTVGTNGSIVAANSTIDKNGITIKEGSITLGTNFSVDSSGAITAKSGYIGNGTNGLTIGNGTLTLTGTGLISNANVDMTSTGITIYGNRTNSTIVAQLDANGLMLQGGANTAISIGASQTLGDYVFKVDSAGNLTASSADIKGKITSTNGSIGGWTIGTDSISKGNVTIDSANTKITLIKDASHSITLDGATGLLSANNVDIAGTITATDGKIGSWFIRSTGIYDTDTTSEKMSITPSLININNQVKIGNYTGTSWGLQAGSTTLDSNGITANSGYIAGWTISSTDLYNSNIHIDKSNGAIWIGSAFATPSIKLANDGSAILGKLTISSTGAVSTSTNSFVIDTNGNASFNGSLTSTSGTIAGWSIGASTLSKNNVTLDSNGSIKLGNSNQVILSALSGVNVNGVFTVDLTGAMTATNATITGTVNATSGYFGSSTNGVNIGTNGLVVTGSGVIKNANSEMTQNAFIVYDGEPNVAVMMGEYASGKFGLSAAGGNVILDKDGLVITGSQTSIKLGTLSNGRYNFEAKADGSLYANNATIVGNITATSGSFTGTLNVLSGGKIIAGDGTGDYVKMDNTGIYVVKSGTAQTAITSAGIYGQLLTNQSVAGTAFDKTPPPVPDSSYITLSSSIDQTAWGDVSALSINWKEVSNPDNDLAGYRIYLKEGNAEYLPVAIVPKYNSSETTSICQYNTTTQIYTYSIRNLKATKTYYVRIASFDVQNNISLLSGEKSLTLPKDGTAPATVTGVTPTSAFKAIAIKWNQCSDVDLDYYIVQRCESSDNSTYNTWHTIANVYTDFVIDEGLDYNTYYKYRVCGIDYSDNSGNWSTATGGIKPSQVGNSDIVAHSITAELLSIGSVVKSINAQETTLFHFDGTLMSTQGATPYVEEVDDQKIFHQSGFFRKDAKFGASLSIEEDTTNLVATATNGNANFKYNSNGWTIGNGIFRSINGVEGIDDGYIEVGYDWSTCTQLTVTPGKTYTVSAYGKAVDSSSRLRVDISPVDGDKTKWSSNGTGTWNGTSTLTYVIQKNALNDWDRAIGTFTVPAASNTTTVKLYVLQDGGAGKVAADNIQVEERTYATSFINGTKPEGYVDYYAPSMLNPTEGTISMWLKNIIGWHVITNNDHSITPYVDNLFIWGNSTETNKILAKYDREHDLLTVIYGTSTLTYTFPKTGTNAIANTDWVHFVFRWKNGSQELRINGVIVGTDNKPAITLPSDKLFRLGYFPRMNGSTIIEEYDTNPMEKLSRASCLIDELRLDKVINNTDDVNSWYNQRSSFYDAAAQIDADSQNISAANASVTINNEGITVKDGKILVESEDGKILLKDGRLSVNGLDVGVPQSDNGIYNGNFTIPDITDSVSDPYTNMSGVARYGAKYWRIKRSSLPVKNSMAMSVAWKRVNITSFVGEDEIRDNYYSNINGQVKYVAMLSPNDPSVDPKGQNATYMAYAANTAKSSLASNDPVILAFNAFPNGYGVCINELNTIAGEVVSTLTVPAKTDNDTRIANDLTTALTNAGVSDANSRAAMIGFTQAVAIKTESPAVGALYDIKNSVEYSVTGVIMQQAPSLSADAKTAGRKAARSAINQYINDYSTSDAALNSTISTSIGSSGIASAEQQVLIPIVSGTIIGNLPSQPGATTLVKENIESTTEGKVNDSYDKLINYNLGLEEHNDDTGVIKTTIYHIDDTGEIYKVNVNPANIDINTAIDPSTGLPPTEANAETGGNTNIFIHPFEKKFGREGYVEIGVPYSVASADGVSSELVELSQDATGLTTYTDGIQARGTNYRQNTFSFNGVWKEDINHNFLVGPTGKLAFEVEELVPIKPRLRNMATGQYTVLTAVMYPGQNTATVTDVGSLSGISTVFIDDEKFTIQSVDSTNKIITFDHAAAAAHLPMTYIQTAYQTDSNGFFKLYPSQDIYVSPYLTTIQQVVMTNSINKQYLAVGNATFDPVTYGYTINSMMNADTMYSDLATMTPRADGPYSYDVYQNGSTVDGYVQSGIWYDNNIAEADRSKYTPGWTVETRTQDSVTYGMISSNKLGDFMVMGFDTYANCNIDVSVWAGPDSGAGLMVLDGDKQPVDASYPKSQYSALNLDDYPSGKHTVVVLNLGAAGVSTAKNIKAPTMRIIGCKIYDWNKVNAGTNNIDNLIEWTQDGIYESGILADKIVEKGKWNTAYIEPKYANSLDAQGNPLYPEMTPIKYKAKVSISRDSTDTTSAYAYITGIQAELGTNPSYTRNSSGQYSIPGYMIQPYNISMWNTSGIQARHYEEYLSWYPGETGVQERHIANGQVTASKIGNSVIVNSHIAKGNISYDKTRIKRGKLEKTELSLDDFIVFENGLSSSSDITTSIRAMYLDYIAMTPDAVANNNSYYFPANVAKDSETVIENGQILDFVDDYVITLHTGLISAKDIWNIAAEYGMNVGTTERTLTTSEYSTLANLLATTNLYDINNKSAITTGMPLITAVRNYDVMLYVKVKLNGTIETVNNYTDKYRIVFWEEL